MLPLTHHHSKVVATVHILKQSIQVLIINTDPLDIKASCTCLYPFMHYMRESLVRVIRLHQVTFTLAVDNFFRA